MCYYLENSVVICLKTDSGISTTYENVKVWKSAHFLPERLVLLFYTHVLKWESRIPADKQQQQLTLILINFHKCIMSIGKTYFCIVPYW